MDALLHSRVKLAVNFVDSIRWKPSKATKDANISRQSFGMCKVFCSLITLRKEERLMANNVQHYWSVWRKKSPKNGHKQRKKCSFTKTIHCITIRLQRWQNYMNCTLNWFHSHPILQIWPPATTGCLQTSKEFSLKVVLLVRLRTYREMCYILYQYRAVENRF